jgi:hypothetical protein
MENSCLVGLGPGPNPTTSNYNASVVKYYNVTSSRLRFEKNNIFFYFEERSIILDFEVFSSHTYMVMIKNLNLPNLSFVCKVRPELIHQIDK